MQEAQGDCWVLECGRGKKRQRGQCDAMEGLNQSLLALKMEGPRAKNCRCLHKVGKIRKQICYKSLQRETQHC